MDFGVLSLDALVGSETTAFSPLASESETRGKLLGSLYLKQGRSGQQLVEDDWRSFKLAKTDARASSFGSNSLFQDQPQQQQFLNFSSPKNESFFVSNDGLVERSLHSGSLSYYHPSPTYGRNTGGGSGSLTGSSMHGVLAGFRGPFTTSQWIELEHQALIYKYINANMPIPSNLLRTLNPSEFTVFPAGSIRSNSLGWGSIHLGFSGNTDPEPGRCRRTDGKKWRCSRDAVADQKYCERHMNRGRHRSRKPVEGQNGHAALMPTTSISKKLPIVSAGVGGKSNSLDTAHHEHIKTKFTQIGPDPTSATHISRILLNKSNVDDRTQDKQGFAIKDTSFPILKQQIPFEESSRPNFGLVPSNSLMNPVRSSHRESGNFSNSSDCEPQSHSLRHFIDDWPKNQSNRSSLNWPELEKIQSDRTQLSISIPVASSDFSSSSSSPTHEKMTLSPLKLSCELDQIQMGLGVGEVFNEATQRQPNWVPISWETSMGGPLGEVLKNSNNAPRDLKKSPSALNLMTGRWDVSPKLESSPTGVLQKSTYGSLSNSSTGSSPRAENKTRDMNTSLCDDDLLDSTLVNSAAPRRLSSEVERELTG